MQPCDDLRVLDLSSGPVGGVATMVLADFGADVVKVERPGGDPWRRLPNAPVWLRGKRSIELDLATPGGLGAARRLARGSDVVVASFRPGAAKRLGVDYETLADANPGLVYTSVTAWGPRGPYAGYPGYEGLVAAKSGRMQQFAGQPQREGPAYAAVLTGSHGAAQSAVAGTLAALLARERLGRGQLVETSLLQGLFCYEYRELLWRQLEARFPELLGGTLYRSPTGPPTLQYQPVRCKDDRWIQLANLLEHHFLEYIGAIGLGELMANERYLGMPGGISEEAREEVRERMLLRMQERTAEEWMQLFIEHGNVAAEAFSSAVEALDHPDVIANGLVTTIEDPEIGPVRQPGPIARLAETPGRAEQPAPQPGEHSEEVLAETPRQPWKPASTADPPRHALEGVTVLDFATIIAGPFGSALLADLGARVIKIEPPGGDPMRGLGTGYGTFIGVTRMNGGKESICLDLKTEEGSALAAQLAERADVLVHNWRPGVAERLGLGYEQLRERNPRLVYIRSMGYGPDGPSASRPSAHPLPGAVVGGALRQAGAGMPPTAPDSLDEVKEAARQLGRANEANPDPNTSLLVASSALLALRARERMGRGQEVIVSMLQASAYAGLDDCFDYEGRPDRREVDADLRGLSPLYRLYEARDGWVFLAAPLDEEWARLASTLGEGLADEQRFGDQAAREANAEALVERLGEIFATRDAADWERELIAAGVGCVDAGGVVLGGFLLEDPQIEANGWVFEAEHKLWGRYQRWGPAVTLSETPGRFGPGPLCGQHTDALLRELGCDDEEIARLRASGAVPPSEGDDPVPWVESAAR